MNFPWAQHTLGGLLDGKRNKCDLLPIGEPKRSRFFPLNIKETLFLYQLRYRNQGAVRVERKNALWGTAIMVANLYVRSCRQLPNGVADWNERRKSRT